MYLSNSVAIYPSNYLSVYLFTYLSITRSIYMDYLCIYAKEQTYLVAVIPVPVD